MQEEVENKSVAISIKATKLTANVLKAALLKALAAVSYTHLTLPTNSRV